jgi:RNA polymerase sigma factor (sigma-70 family)
MTAPNARPRPQDHLGLAHMACRSYRHHVGRGFDYGDLFQAACIGLIEAADTYDPEKGAFSTHALPRAKRQVQILVETQCRTVRIPRTAQVKAAAAVRPPARPAPENPRPRRTVGAPFDWDDPDNAPSQVLQVTHLTYKGVPSTWSAPAPAGIHHPTAERSFDFVIGDDGGHSMHDVHADEAPSPLELAAERELADWSTNPRFTEALGTLTPRERVVIKNRLRGWSQPNLAIGFRLTKARIQQIEAAAVRKLREVFR